MRALLLAVALLAACGDNKSAPKPDDAGIDSPSIDAGIDAPPQALAPCLDRPTDLPRPPGQAQLPCDLIPPPGLAP